MDNLPHYLPLWVSPGSWPGLAMPLAMLYHLVTVGGPQKAESVTLLYTQLCRCMYKCMYTDLDISYTM